MIKTVRLTDLQFSLLNTAAQRDDGSLLPPSDDVGERTAAIDKAIMSLVRRGLAGMLDTSDAGGNAFGAEDPLVGVRISSAGRMALGIVEEPNHPPQDEASVTKPAAAAPRTTKASQVLAMLQRAAGATLEELVAATGWLPHTTRAALTGLRRKGHSLSSEKVDGVRRYRVPAPVDGNAAQ